MSMRRAPAPDGALLSPSWSSSFSSKYSIHQMLESPMPSPALPSIIPRHGKKPKSNRLRKVLRGVLPLLKWMSGVLVIGWFLKSSLSGMTFTPEMDDYSLDESHLLNADDISFQDPMPILISNSKKGTKVSVSLPAHLQFPLRPSEYSAICSRYDEVARRLQHQNSRSGFHQKWETQDYYYANPDFMDIKEAEGYGLLPVRREDTKLASQPNLQGSHGKFREKEPSTHLGTIGEVCEKTLTYVLETTDAGIGKTLLGLWLSYGLSKEEGRAFFIDDSNWSYGKYADLFKPPPIPSCLPAPPHHRLPCPHQARHLVVSTSTSHWTFGTAFREHFRSHGNSKSHPQGKIFALLRTGFEALFHLAHQDTDYLTTRLSELADLRLRDRRVVGLHVRRGDRHPWEPQYQDSFTPLETYVDAANDFITREFHPNAANSSAISQSEKTTAELKSLILLASDDPDVYDTPELINTNRAQRHISLANKAALDAARPAAAPKSPDTEVTFKKFVEGNVGWEGGFFPSVFWGLGDAEAGSVAARGLREEREDPAPSELSLSLRGLVARAYLLDLKVLGASDAVVCGVSSIGCRLLAVMLGWEKAIVERRWINIDGGFGWTAFEEDKVR